MSKVMQQITVMRNNDENQPVAFTTWVEADKRLKIGSVIEFKGDESYTKYKWTILEIYDRQVEMEQIDFHGWDNNNYDKHAGLGL